MNGYDNSKVLLNCDGKNIFELIKEFSELNINHINDSEEIKNFINALEIQLKIYANMNISKIKEEFYKIRNCLKNEMNQINLICLMIQANYCLFGYYPRYTQLISLFYFIKKNKLMD